MQHLVKESACRVQAALNQYGLDLQVVEMQDSTRTAQEAADAVGCQVGQIAKSLIFKGKKSEEPLLIIASGSNRVNEKKFKELIGEPLVRPDASYVLANTGYAIGGIPPIGHSQKLNCFIDEDLFQYEKIWAAAGTPFALFQLTPDDLLKITEGKVISVL
ncbi:MAG: YbaK/EbsC family protein [Sporomusaceae bacterium]|nr:YbaK/EbsC family protein [Sporomusaceae bacterium]